MKVNWVSGLQVHRIGLDIPEVSNGKAWDDFVSAIEVAILKEEDMGNPFTKICFGNELPEWQVLVNLELPSNNITESKKLEHSKLCILSACHVVVNYVYPLNKLAIAR